MRWSVARLRGFGSSAAMFCSGCGASACSVGGSAARATGKGPSARALRICVEECGGALGVQQTVSLFSKICCATILQYQNTTFISWQQMFLNAETLSMIPGFVLEINHAFLWEGIRNGKHAVPAPGSAATAYTLLDRRRLQVRFPVLARLNWWQTILAAVVASLVAIVVTMLVGWQYTQPIAA